MCIYYTETLCQLETAEYALVVSAVGFGVCT